MKKLSVGAIPRGFLLCFILLAVLCFPAGAQTKSWKVTGTVKDSTQKLLPYVTVSLFRSVQLQEPLKSTYTNDAGKFQFLNTDTGSYLLIFSHTGFSDQQQDIIVTDKDVVVNEISLLRSNGNLKDITVVARKPLIEQTDDKIIFNVENDPATKTETAIDILRKTPFVSVDGDDNVQVNGQSSFKVLLNGRETAMFAQNVKEALKGFPGSLITKIEVITSPSAKYDGEGVGGVINIITKKKVVGYNGSLSTYYSSTKWYNVNGNFSAKFGKFGVTVFYGAGGTTGQRGKNFTQTIPAIPSLFTKRTLQGDRWMKNFWNNGNGEISYELDSLNTFSAYGNVSGGYNKSKFDQAITTDFPSSPSSVSYYDLASRNEYPTISIGTDYIKKFRNNKEREFSIRLNSEFGKANSFLDSEQDNPLTDRFIINNSIASNKQYTIQSDYIHPFKNNRKLETGVKAILRRASSDFESLIKYDPSHDFKINDSNTDNFNYDQDVYSVYSSYSFKAKKTTFRLGARVEHTSVDGDFSSSSTKVKQTYTTLLPNLQATTKLSNALTLVLGYNRRLQRPFIWNLNPFVNNNDSLNISYGNPGLGPQTINSFSVQTRIMKGGNFAGLTFEGSYSGDKILQYASFDPATGVTRTTSLNIGKELQLSITGNISAKINTDWNIFLNGNVRYNKVTNNKQAGQANSGIGGNANLNTSYKIGKKFTASGYAGFWRGPVTIQTKFPLNIWYGTGMGYKFFKEKLTASLMGSNFFQKNRDYRMVTTDPNFQTTSVTTMPFGGVALSLSWNFGKLTENVSKKKGVTNDDLLGNGQSGN
ncbi:MAG: TonB-dependent receptor [Ferruginibacter sp.]|nr:TonB-dependent receptor [Chitinophagaceae bacterium]